MAGHVRHCTLRLTSTTRHSIRSMSSITNSAPRVAVLYQAIEPPIVGGVRKPMKPGGTPELIPTTLKWMTDALQATVIPEQT